MDCTICGTSLRGNICPNCGFDESQNREKYPTLANDGIRLRANAARRDALYASLTSQSAAEEVRSAPSSANTPQQAAVEQHPPLTQPAQAGQPQPSAPYRPVQPAPYYPPQPAPYQAGGSRKSKKAVFWAIAAVVPIVILFIVLGSSGKNSTTPSATPKSSSRTKSQSETASARVEAQRTEPVVQKTEPVVQRTEPSVQNTEDTEAFYVPSVGQTMYFGRYEQDDNYSNGKEPIEWIVLDKDGQSALLISKYALERRNYTDVQRDATWADSELRVWLNDSFLWNSFTSEEMGRLMQRYNETQINPQYPDLKTGSATYDTVFVLSYEEVEVYLQTDAKRKCYPTQHLINQGAYINEGGCWWWLRNPGEGQDFAMGVTTKGAIHYAGSEAYDTGCVRPSIVVRYN